MPNLGTSHHACSLSHSALAGKSTRNACQNPQRRYGALEVIHDFVQYVFCSSAARSAVSCTRHPCEQLFVLSFSVGGNVGLFSRIHFAVLLVFPVMQGHCRKYIPL